MDYIDSFSGAAALFGHCSLGSVGRMAPTVGSGPPGNNTDTVGANRINIDPGAYGGPIRIAIAGLGGFEFDSGGDYRTLNTAALSSLQGLD